MDNTRRQPAETIPGIWLLIATAAAALAAAVVGQALLRMPLDELRKFVAYLAVSGVATIAVALLVGQVFERMAGLTLVRRLVIGVGIAAIVGLVNVLVAAWLMFISTGHDLLLLVALLLFSSLLTVLFTLTTVSGASRGMDRVARAIGQLTLGNYAHRLPVFGRDEVGRLSAEVNDLAARLEESRERQQMLDRERRQLTVSVSHDLRTPLASIRAMVEALADGVVQSGDERQRYYSHIRREIERLAAMLDDLFDLSRLDAGAFPLDRVPIPLEEVVADVVDGMQFQAERLGVALRLSAPRPLPTLWLDGTQMQRVVANLVRNALEHTPSGGMIDVTLDTAGDHVQLEVRDTGDGIPAEDLERIWERFYRGDPSRQKGPGRDGGSGLGLAIVKGIVAAHGGTVGATSQSGCGATFIVSLPLADDPRDSR